MSKMYIEIILYLHNPNVPINVRPFFLRIYFVYIVKYLEIDKFNLLVIRYAFLSNIQSLANYMGFGILRTDMCIVVEGGTWLFLALKLELGDG